MQRELPDPLEQGDQVLEYDIVEAGRRPQVGQAERLVARVVLHMGQGHLQLGPPVGRGGGQEVGGAAAERSGQLVDRRQAGLPVPVLQL